MRKFLVTFFVSKATEMDFERVDDFAFFNGLKFGYFSR